MAGDGKNDTGSESTMAGILRSGVSLAAAVVLAGGVIYLIRYGMTMPDYRVFRGEPTDLRSVRGITSEAITFHGRGIIQLGLLVLIATPVTRVAFSIVMFIMEEDRLYTAITVVVLSLLIYSLLGGPQ